MFEEACGSQTSAYIRLLCDEVRTDSGQNNVSQTEIADMVAFTIIYDYIFFLGQKYTKIVLSALIYLPMSLLHNNWLIVCVS